MQPAPTLMRMRGTMLCTALMAITLAACDGGDDSHAHGTQSDDAGQEAHCEGRGEPLSDVVLTPQDGAAGASLTLLSATPQRPIVGNNSWAFELNVDGEPATGLASAITVTPFMPDHGHGTPTIVRVEEVDDGQYKFEPVHTRMAGYWEVTVSVESEQVDLVFVVKVCVD